MKKRVGSIAGRLLERIGHMTLLRFSLLTGILALAGIGLASVVDGLRPPWMFWTALGAALFGWLLSRARMPAWAAGLLAVLVGTGSLLLTLGRLLRPTGDLILALFIFGRELIRQKLHLSPTDPGPVFTALGTLVQGTAALFTRLFVWIRAVLGGHAAFDPLVSALLWAFAVWLVSVWAAWLVRRHGSVLAAILPAEFLFAYIVYYTRSTTGFFYLLVGVCLGMSLQAADGLAAAGRRWEEKKLAQSSIKIDTGVAAALIILGLLLTASVAPSISIEDIQRAVDRLKKPEPHPALEESLGLYVTPAVVPGFAGAGQSRLPAEHLLRAGAELSQEVVMYVTLDGYSPLPVSAIDRFPSRLPRRYYWRSLEYDGYGGHGWYTLSVNTVAVKPGSLLNPQAVEVGPDGYQLVGQHVQVIAETSGYLFHTGDLVRSDKAYLAAFMAPDDLFGAQIAAKTYFVESRLPEASAAQLEAADTDYPAAIRQHYLQLPENLPERVRDLALEITATRPNAYDRAEAIQAYLRSTYPYTLDVPAPPLDRDVADYFLFTLKKGYCDYYATAMAVMARSVGLPARLVTGYASGAYDPVTARFIVRRADAHSWVEIYFPGYGWIEFEPTASLPVVPRSDDIAPASRAAGSFPRDGRGTDGHQRTPTDWLAVMVFIPLVAAAGYLLLVWAMRFDEWCLLRLSAGEAVILIYRRLYRQGRAWQIAADRPQTAHEFSARLQESIRPLAAKKWMPARVDFILGSLAWLTELYTRTLYGSRNPDRAEHRRAARTWARLFWELHWARLRARIGR
jgi:transglutaminase-like putative cysteine protease